MSNQIVDDTSESTEHVGESGTEKQETEQDSGVVTSPAAVVIESEKIESKHTESEEAESEQMDTQPTEIDNKHVDTMESKPGESKEGVPLVESKPKDSQPEVHKGVGQANEISSAVPSSDSQEQGGCGFVVPQKEILLPGEIETVWEKSQAYDDLLGFITAMGEAVKGKKLRDEYYVSPTVENLVKMLDTLNTYIDEIPPVDQPQRFGNKAYRDWFQRLETSSERLLREALPQDCHDAVPEVVVYLREGCGNATRIDYGTGHEISFLAFLCCLYKIGALTEQDAVATVFTLFNRYLILMRRLQQTYRMEPAGSQGVWNLDDYQFVPFIWGSAQLIEHQRLKPKHYPDPEMCVAFCKDYMLFAAVQYIHQVKTGPFHEHSNQLWNISGVKLWSKVHSGLIKMYKAEVLNKFPVIQHFLFGSLLSVEPVQQAPSTTGEPVQQAWPTTVEQVHVPIATVKPV